jgi:hypothetical protein
MSFLISRGCIRASSFLSLLSILRVLTGTLSFEAAKADSVIICLDNLHMDVEQMDKVTGFFSGQLPLFTAQVIAAHGCNDVLRLFDHW